MGRSTVLVKRGELRVNGPLRLGATGWSPVGTMTGGDTVTVVRPRNGPSLAFAIAVIGGVALATAAAVSTFFVEPSEGAPDEQPVIAAEAPVETASLDPSFLPVRKVVTQHIVVKTDQPEPVKTGQPAEEQATTQAAADIDALTPLDPRWARPTVPSPDVVASVAATITSTSPAVDPADGTETAAIAPDEAYAPPTTKPTDGPSADAATANDPISLVARARPAQMGKAANMRSRPKSGSSVVMVVPQSATVQLVGCKVWCEIVYKGRRGYVYKDFLGGSRRAQGSSKVSAKASANAKPKAVKTVNTADTTSETALPGVETQNIKPLSSRLQ